MTISVFVCIEYGSKQKGATLRPCCWKRLDKVSANLLILIAVKLLFNPLSNSLISCIPKVYFLVFGFHWAQWCLVFGLTIRVPGQPKARGGLIHKLFPSILFNRATV